MYRRGVGKRNFNSCTLSTVHDYCLVSFFFSFFFFFLDASLYIRFSFILLVYITPFHLHSLYAFSTLARLTCHLTSLVLHIAHVCACSRDRASR